MPQIIADAVAYRTRVAAKGEIRLTRELLSGEQTQEKRNVILGRTKIERTEGSSQLHAARDIISEDTHTCVVNAHGALLPLAMTVRPGDALTLKHLMSREEKQIRVVRVTEEEPIALPKVAVAFTAPAPHFWHIDFPPADWDALQE
jgi:hypothetical protein